MSIRMFAFIRAINTGNRRLTNEQLLAPFRAAGMGEVAAYQAAGNITFVTDAHADAESAGLELELSARLTEAYGFEAPTFVRTAPQLRAAVDTLPFAAEELAASRGKTQIAFLAAPPTSEQLAAALELVPADDRVAFVDREWFWLPRAGISESVLPVTRIERIVGPMTMRTVGTVERMLARFPD